MAIEVPKLWPGDTFVILGCGPSLNAADVNHVRGTATGRASWPTGGVPKIRVIAINAAHELAPWADVMYACDAKYWAHVKGAPSFTGLKYGMEATAAKWGVGILKHTGHEGLELRPSGLKTGKNSGYQAINLAVHLGAKRILLLGYDMQKKAGQEHFTRNYPTSQASPYPLFLRLFDTIVAPLKEAGVEVVNCTEGSLLKCFPRRALREALQDHASCAQGAAINHPAGTVSEPHMTHVEILAS